MAEGRQAASLKGKIKQRRVAVFADDNGALKFFFATTSEPLGHGLSPAQGRI
ncbi:hypothetical protein GCM10022280_18420 [Sphingomonas swuensis]|uniref:Uncharacterized protein n=1 Tax=Sphingomonas swuensis TaxID=977800 RepID=A0ABP7SZZ5_9SPHN